jgi:hypothetical protein
MNLLITMLDHLRFVSTACPHRKGQLNFLVFTSATSAKPLRLPRPEVRIQEH